MRILALAALCCGLAVTGPVLRAQESAAAAHGTAPGEEEHGKTLAWMWANFILLVGGLGYLVYKNAGPFYAGRSRKIRKDLIEAEDLRKEADQRAAEIERRLASLEGEIAALREESQREAAAETERLAAQTAADAAKIQVHAEQEIEAAGRAARVELKRYAAALAVDLAAQKIRGRMSDDTQDKLVGSFVRKLDKPALVAQGI
jgi:F-type H+-transporting ATPase subunit b